MGASLLPRAVAGQPAPEPPPPPDPIPLVEVYGSLVPFLEYGHTTSATPAGSHVAGMEAASQVAAYSGVNLPARGVLDPSTTNIGFRGGIELMPNLSAVWQVESSVPVDGLGAPANTFANRNSNLGVTGTWGTLFFGNWDTPYSWITKSTVNPVKSGNLTDYNSILDNPGFGISSVTTQPTRAAAAADAAWERRQGNSVQYWTPNISGVSGRLAVSVNEGRTATTPMAPSIGPSLWSAAVAVDVGPIKIREAAEVHFDYFGMSQIGGSPGATNTNRSSTDWGNKLLAQYTNPLKGAETRVLGIAEFLSYKNKDSLMGANNTYSRWSVYGLVEQTFGKHHIWVGGGKAFEGDCEKVQGTSPTTLPCLTTGLSATDVVVGYLYRASKSFDFWAAAYRISNDFAASYTSSPSIGAPPAPGTMIEAIGIGMYYTFSAKIIGPPTKPAAAPPPPPTVPTPAPTSEPGPVPPPNAPEPPPNVGTPPPPNPNPKP
jgi:predicted porin